MSPNKLELIYEDINDLSLNKYNEILKWYNKISKKNHCWKIKTKPLNQIVDWEISNEGNLKSKKKFFEVIGIKVQNTHDREVGSTGWEQPLIKEKNSPSAIIGILRKRFNDVPHYLIEAKAEPGNFKFTQIGATVQATLSNINRNHKGKLPTFSNYFINYDKKNLLFKKKMSEDGGRFYKKITIGICLNTSKNIKLPKRYLWATKRQIKRIIYDKSCTVHPHLRALISYL